MRFKKFWLLALVFLLAGSLLLAGCGEPANNNDNNNEVNGEEPGDDVVLNRYRGIFEDGGVQQVAVQFHLDEDGTIYDMSFRHLEYGGTDYRELEEDHALYAVVQQHEQIIEYLEGKNIDEIDALHNPGDFVEDVDGMSGATVRANKVYSAMRDALNRGIYSPGNGVADLEGDFEDGRYRGVFGDRGDQQIAVQFHLNGNIIEDMSFRHLYHGGNDYREMEEGDALYPIVEQHEQIIEYLEGQDIRTVLADLHNPGDFIEDVDGFSGATVRANKVYSAMMDGLARGLYAPGNGVADVEGDFEDGRYRGTFGDRGDIQVGVQFHLNDNVIEDMSFRYLYYGGTDFRELEEDHAFYGVAEQHEQIIEYLEGQDIRTALADLHYPGDFIEDVDNWSGASVRANKVYSAMRSALARGVYQYR
ncbi:FMN-binding protein [Dethiobacter alkaliphilus]|uniref:FMN-binding domain-containing protein n=1 Tax=Dethiobacter alkaliphilus AHT 1 TaxID=555088 RepID=C0GJ73_DETAL|nr:FMN-binding protein [Dethiobacter alkaliphilus]EEG76558.1 conserved hypothetical protein [Dethiobacter alkaliphilus AHT 1]